MNNSDKLPDPPLRDVLISTQDLPPRVMSLLIKRFRLHTLSDIFSKFNNINSLYQTSGVAEKTVNEIIRLMESHGCRVEDGHFKAPSYYLGDGCVCCPVDYCDTSSYRGSRCAELRDRSGITTDPEIDFLDAQEKSVASQLPHV